MAKPDSDMQTLTRSAIGPPPSPAPRSTAAHDGAKSRHHFHFELAPVGPATPVGEISNSSRRVERLDASARAQPQRPAETVAQLGRRVDAKGVIDRRRQVRRTITARDRMSTEPVRLADQLAANHPGTGEHGREDRRPVVAPGYGIAASTARSAAYGRIRPASRPRSPRAARAHSGRRAGPRQLDRAAAASCHAAEENWRRAYPRSERCPSSPERPARPTRPVDAPAATTGQKDGGRTDRPAAGLLARDPALARPSRCTAGRSRRLVDRRNGFAG